MGGETLSSGWAGQIRPVSLGRLGLPFRLRVQRCPLCGGCVTPVGLYARVPTRPGPDSQKADPAAFGVFHGGRGSHRLEACVVRHPRAGSVVVNLSVGTGMTVVVVVVAVIVVVVV